MARSRGSRLSIAALALALAFTTAMFCFVPPQAVGATGSAHGQILDLDGKPWANVSIVLTNDLGRQFQVKTDKNGNFRILGLDPGKYTVKVTIPTQQEPYKTTTHVGIGENVTIDLNFKELVAKQGGPSEEERKKQAEEDRKFESLKGHFTTGNE
ncbi:MAG: carboxypeptidase-like regulatory domain-containing protein [Candidatus Acidiferrales bacterium]